ncbi:terpenoid synthase, partial [Setomelanomma holmii]
ESRDRFANAVYTLIDAVRASQAKWIVGVSSFVDYAERRRAGVGIDIIVTAVQWLHGLSLPPRIWEHQAMSSLMHETAISVYLFNDVVSLKKEVGEGFFDSTVPILVWNKSISPQAAVNEAVKMMENSWQSLLAAAETLKYFAKTEQDKREVQVLINSCKDIVVAHVAYCLRSSRYIAGITFEGCGKAFKIEL